MSRPILYNNWKSSCSWRVRIALALKGIDYEYKPVNLTKNEQKTPEYLQINHRVWSLCFREVSRKRKLLPKNPEDRAKVRELTLSVSAGIQPLQNMKVREYYAQGDKDKLNQWAIHWIENGFQALERELKKYSGRCAYGDNPTMLDTVIPPQVFNAVEKFGFDMSKFPTIKVVNDRLSQVEMIKRAHPNSQPDAPINK